MEQEVVGDDTPVIQVGALIGGGGVLLCFSVTSAGGLAPDWLAKGDNSVVLV